MRRKLFLATIMAAAVALQGACSGGAGPKSTPTPTSAAATPTPPPGPTSTPTGGGGAVTPTPSATPPQGTRTPGTATECDLKITKTSAPNVPTAGTITYTIAVDWVCVGTPGSTGVPVLVHDLLPVQPNGQPYPFPPNGTPSMTVSTGSSVPAGTPCTAPGPTPGPGFGCNLGILQPGGHVEVTFALDTGAGQNLTNTAQVDPFNQVAEINEGNNQAQVTNTGCCTPSSPPTTGTITIILDAQPDNAQDFTFTGPGLTPATFIVDDDTDPTLANTQVFSSVPAGTYTITETVPPGWKVKGIGCTGAGSWSTGAASVTITLAGGSSVTCTFVNSP